MDGQTYVRDFGAVGAPNDAVTRIRRSIP
jgi:hypothetical protein